MVTRLADKPAGTESQLLPPSAVLALALSRSLPGTVHSIPAPYTTRFLLRGWVLSWGRAVLQMELHNQPGF